MADLIDRQAAIDVLDVGKELLSCALDNMDIVGNDREKFEWGLGLIESYIDDIKDIPSAQLETHDKRTETHACDLISRQEALDVVNDCGICIQKIVDLPSAHPQRKTGKWKWVNDSDGCIDEVECDQCGDLEIYKSNYCPNCGARMER